MTQTTRFSRSRSVRRRPAPISPLALAARRLVDVSRQYAEAHTRVQALESHIEALQHVQSTLLSDRLSAILTICGALLMNHDGDQILKLIAEQGVRMFPGASGALLFLYDPDDGLLHLRAGSNGAVPSYAVEPGQCAPGRAFLAPRAMLVAGAEMEASDAELDGHQRTLMAQLVQPWPAVCALLAPLRVERQQLGALVIYAGTNAHMFHPRDLSFVQALADLAAVAIVEYRERSRVVLLQRNLDETQSAHAEAQARLNTAQAQLLQSAKLAAVGELAASVAHEINNPLYAARNSLYLVAQDLPNDSPQLPFLNIAQNELGRIARIITRMRDFYRPARDELEPISVNNLLEETIELVYTHLRHGHVIVQTDLAPELPMMQAHADQLRQVFLNLMLNACDAMKSGGILRVITSTRHDSGTHRSTIQVQVIDNGCGIAPEHLPYLFEPFYTTKPHGTGLGLAISAHIVTQHGGHIQVDSHVGEGSTFTIALPVETAA